MGLFRRLMGSDGGTARTDFVDLGDYNVQLKEEPAGTLIKVAELVRLEDVPDLAQEVYGGHILLLDIRNVAKDEFQLKRVTGELKRVATDVGGDVAGIGEGLIAVTPRGIRVDRQKIRLAA